MVKLCGIPLEVEDFSLSVTTLIQQLHMCFAPVLEPILPSFPMCGLTMACDFSAGLWSPCCALSDGSLWYPCSLLSFQML